jgi:type I restriction enzyme S subunit
MTASNRVDTNLGDLTKILSGFAFSSKSFGDDGDLPVIRIRNVVSGSSNTFYSGEFDDKFIIENGDLLIGMDGEFNRAKWQGGRALLNQRVCRISSANPQLDEQYLFHFLPSALKRIEDTTPFVTVKHLSVKKIEAIPISLPPLEEQKRIAAILDAADQLRTKRQQAIEKVELLIKSVFVQKFGDETGLSGPTCLLTDLADLKVGYAFKSTTFTQDGSGIRICRGANILPGKISWKDTERIPEAIAHDHQEFALRAGDVLVAMDRPWISSGFKVAQITEEDAGSLLVQRVARLRPKDGIPPSFIFELMQMPKFAKHCVPTETTIPHISPKDFQSFEVPAPSTSDLLDFGRAADILTKTAANVSAHFDKLANLAAALQQQAFRGDL